MKLTTSIVALAITAGTVWAQSPNVTQNTKSALQGAQPKQAAASKPASGQSAKPAAASPAKPAAATQAKAAPSKPSTSAPAAKPAVAPQASKAAVSTTPAKPSMKGAAPKVKVAAAPKPAPQKPAKIAVAAPAEPKAEPSADDSQPDNQQDKKYSMTGKRDPFVSPVVNRQSGAGCSTGKKCLDIEQVALRGVVRSDGGMIAVVTNAMNKAYFLRENDPVFNGYVVKITGDSIVFKQTFQDKLGKPFTKDVVKKITTPAV